MRIRFLIITLLLCFNIQAQNISFGLEQHIGVSSFSRALLPFEFKLSSSTGIVAEKQIAQQLVLQSGLYYHQSGVGNEVYWPYNNDYIEVKEKVTCSYLRMPILLKVKVGKGGRLTLGAGGYFSLFLQQNIRTDNKDYPYTGGGPWVDLELEDHDYGMILRQELNKLFERVDLYFGMQEEISLNPVAYKTLPYGIYAFAGIKWNKP